MEKKKVLLVGSGLTAPLAKEWDLSNWTVCVIHNAWKVLPERFDILIHADDFPQDKKPTILQSHQKMVCTLPYVREANATNRHGGFWRNHCGFGKTMFFSAFWWIYEQLQPEIIGFVGCDMHYPAGSANTFYGAGQPDPLKYPLNALNQWLGFLDGYAVRDNVTLINYSPYESPTLLPFSHGLFPEETPIDRPREHRVEFYPQRELAEAI